MTRSSKSIRGLEKQSKKDGNRKRNNREEKRQRTSGTAHPAQALCHVTRGLGEGVGGLMRAV